MKKILNLYRFFLRPLGRFFSTAVIVFSVVIFSSCSKNNSGKSYSVANDGSKYILHKNNDSLSDEIRLKQAKNSDLPIPVGYKFVELIDFDDDLHGQKKDFFCYAGDLNIEQLARFYRINMERLGWHISDLSVSNEGLLFGKKANKECAISIRDNGNVCELFSKKSYVCLFVKSKTYSEKKSASIDLNSKEIPRV